MFYLCSFAFQGTYHFNSRRVSQRRSIWWGSCIFACFQLWGVWRKVELFQKILSGSYLYGYEEERLLKQDLQGELYFEKSSKIGDSRVLSVYLWLFSPFFISFAVVDVQMSAERESAPSAIAIEAVLMKVRKLCFYYAFLCSHWLRRVTWLLFHCLQSRRSIIGHHFVCPNL